MYQYNIILDSIISGLTTRFEATHAINNIFCFLWKYRQMSDTDISDSTSEFALAYQNDVSDQELKEEVIHLKKIHIANFGNDTLKPTQLLNKLSEYNLLGVLKNVGIALRIFCTLPVTVASAERSFSKLKLIKNDLRTQMTQGRLNDLASLSNESDLAMKVDFSE